MNEKIKKIGILTFHNSINNGAVMQAYSLSKKIQQEFPKAKVEIIDYQMPKVKDAYHFSLKKILLTKNPLLFTKRLVKSLTNLGYNRKLNERTKIFENCKYLLPLSSFSLLSNETDELFTYINNEYDVLIVGSDAVWNYLLRGFPNAYFPDTSVNVNKMSYAASCYGMEFLNCSENEKRQIGEILQDFSFLGVRDTATEEFVKWSNCSKLPVHVCDPTVFLDVDDLPINISDLELKLKNRGFDFNRPTIGMMGNEKMFKMIRKMYGKKYQIASLYIPIKGADVNLYDLTPYEWAYVFRYFKITFTTYFHGTLLSLRNGIPVICISLQTEFGKKHTPKTLDVLTRLGFENCYFKTDYVNENINSIKLKSDELLASDLRDEILQKMNIEAKSFNAFRLALLSLLEEKDNG